MKGDDFTDKDLTKTLIQQSLWQMYKVTGEEIYKELYEAWYNNYESINITGLESKEIQQTGEGGKKLYQIPILFKWATTGRILKERWVIRASDKDKAFDIVDKKIKECNASQDVAKIFPIDRKYFVEYADELKVLE